MFPMLRTALHQRLQAMNARMGEYEAVQTAALFSDPIAEWRALRSGCGVFDLGWRGKILVTGNDRTRWLNRMITNNVRDLAVSRGVYSFLLNAQGRIQGDLYVYNRGEFLVIDSSLAQLARILELLDHYIVMDKVELKDISDQFTSVGVRGPQSRGVLGVAGLQVADMQPLEIAEFQWREKSLTVVRMEANTPEGYELWLAPADAPVLWDALVDAGATPVGTEALEILRVASGTPRYGQDIRERDLPQETEQYRALNFNKGCYLGQEIVERIRSRGQVHRRFTGFEVAGQAPPPGTKIHLNGTEIGEITSATTLPTKGLALGYVRREAVRPDADVRAGEVGLTVAELPFTGID
jgi:folate-binding protein YgfZ